MTSRSELLTPLPANEWADEIRAIADQLGTVLNIHSIIAHNPVLMQAYTPLRMHLVTDSTLTPRQRELLILRTAHNIQSKYEWQHHVLRGQDVGLSDEEIGRVRQGPEASGWSVEDATLLRCADEMQQDFQLTVETAVTLQTFLTPEAILDTIFTIGVYLTLGTILRTFDVPLEDTITPLTN